MTDDNLPCWVYRSPRHQEMYLYLSEEEAFERVPDALREHFSEPEIMELMLHLALYVGMGRLAATLDMTEELPSSFRAAFGEQVTPWGGEPVPVR